MQDITIRQLIFRLLTITLMMVGSGLALAGLVLALSLVRNGGENLVANSPDNLAHAQGLEEELPPFEGGPVFDTIIQQKQNGRRPDSRPTVRQLPGSTQQRIFQPPSGVVQQLSLTYDRAGNITRLEEQADTLNKLTTDFSYDDLHRLNTANTSGLASGQSGFSHRYRYSPTGNILEMTGKGTFGYTNASTPGFSSPSNLTNPQAVTEVTDTQGVVQHFEYDANGNLIRDGRYVHEWDFMNRLTKTTDTQTGTTLENMYLGMKRVAKTVKTSGQPDQTTFFIGDTYEVLPNGDTRTNIYADLGGSQPLHVATVENKSGTETINYIHSDHLGSSGLVTDQNGDIVELTSYFPFGEARHDITSTDFDERHEFTGYEKDDETGLNYANARYYQSDIGKFISQDPFLKRMGDLMGVLSDPQALNSYSYAGNNPVKNTDPTGEAFEDYVQGLIDTGGSLMNVVSHPLQSVYSLGQGVKAIYNDPLGTTANLINNTAQTIKIFNSADPVTRDRMLGQAMGSLGLSVIGGNAVAGVKGLKLMPLSKIKFIEIDATPDIAKVLNRIDRGEKFPHKNDGALFRNDQKTLPIQKSGYYKEYVVPTDGKTGIRRLIIGGKREVYYTPDHYKTFKRVRQSRKNG